MPCVQWRPYSWKKERNNQICRSKHPRLMEVTTPYFVPFFFFFFTALRLMINSFKDHQRPNSRRWPNAWKSPPLSQNSRNNPSHSLPSLRISSNWHTLAFSGDGPHSVECVSFQINQCTSYLSLCDGNVGGNTWVRGKASSGRARGPLTNSSISSKEQDSLNWASHFILGP